MSYVTILWTGVAAASLLLAIMHTLVWVLDRRAYASLAFAVVAFAAVGIAWEELGLMHAQTPEEWGRWVRWFHPYSFCMMIGTVVYVRLYLGTGRVWLLWAIVAIRVVILLQDFLVDPNFNFARIDSIDRVNFLGEQVTVVGHAVTSPWQVVATLSNVLNLAFLVDASVSLWRRGTPRDREKALVVGGGLVFFYLTAVLFTQLTVWRVLKWPTVVAPSFLVTLAAMAFAMSRDMLRASRLAAELRDSQRGLELAASAAGLGLWSWDTRTNRLWTTQKARAMFGLDGLNTVELEQLTQLIPEEDLQRIRDTLQRAAQDGSEQEVQFRAGPTSGSQRWLLAVGRFESEANAKPTLIRGVLSDITARRLAQEEMDELRTNLAHAARVTVLGQLVSTLAHELRQPLAAILVNVKAAQMLLQSQNPDLQTLGAIIEDLYRDDRRAAEVIERLTALLRRRPLEIQPVPIDSFLRDAMALLRTDASTREVSLEASIDSGSPVAMGDRVHLSQVLINLIINAMDAVAGMPAARRRVIARARATEEGSIEISVADRGTGVPHEAASRIFDPFFTTKAAGMGMGLSVSRSIVELHGGRLWVENNAEGGATFYFTLPVFREARSRPAAERAALESSE